MLKWGSDLDQMSSKKNEGVRMCGLDLGECLLLIGTGRHFVGLYCHMPLPILPLIRVAITGAHAFSTRRQTHLYALAPTQWLDPLHVISSSS